MHSSRTMTLGLALTGLCALGAATARPATAQTLTVGNFNPVEGGTTTISGSGTTASGIYQYRDTNQHPVPLPPGTTSYNTVDGVGPSTVTLNTGGTIGTLTADNGTLVNILGGSVGGLFGDMNSTINISGGFTTTVGAGDGSTANISGGNIDSLNAAAGGFANINGGTVSLVSANISGIADIFGGNLSALTTDGTATINVFGTGLTKTFLGVDGGGQNNYDINGILQDGTALVNLPYTDHNGTGHLNFNAPVPEASTTVSFGLLLAFGMGGIVIAAKRKKTAA